MVLSAWVITDSRKQVVCLPYKMALRISQKREWDFSTIKPRFSLWETITIRPKYQYFVWDSYEALNSLLAIAPTLIYIGILSSGIGYFNKPVNKEKQNVGLIAKIMNFVRKFLFKVFFNPSSTKNNTAHQQ